MARISEVTRRNIRDLFVVGKIRWSGRLEEAEFLGRIYDLEDLPSKDGRYNSARGDITQHRTMNFDWEDDWVFYDSRFRLMTCEDEEFLTFLCETIHPAVRFDPDDVRRILEIYNSALIHDGFLLVESGQISERPIYAGRYVGKIPGPELGPLLKKPLIVDSSYVAQQIRRMMDAIEPDPGLAIGTAKELIETVSKTILDAKGMIYSKSAGAPELARQAARALKLTPDDIPERTKAYETIRRLLSNLCTIPQGMAELRNHFGTGHGRTAKTKGLLPRHARLAAGAAAALATFFIETHEEKAGDGD